MPASGYNNVPWLRVLCCSFLWLTPTGKASQHAELNQSKTIESHPSNSVERLTEDSSARALDPKLSLETRRYLLYLYARLNKPKLAERLAEAIFKEAPSDKQTWLVLASMYIERKEPEKALLAAGNLARYFPEDHQALYFLGAAYYQAGQFDKSNDILRRLKQTHFEDNLYPYQTDLASAALQAGDWYRAMLAYQELLRHHDISEPLRLEARKVLERIYRDHLPQLAVEGDAFLLDQGSIWRASVDHRQHITDSQRLILRWQNEENNIDAGPFLQSRSMNRQEGWIGIETTYSRRWLSTIWAGGAESGALAGMEFTRKLGEQRTVSAAFAYNERAEEGLLMNSLDGRRHRLSFYGDYLLERSWIASFDLNGRGYEIDSEHLGVGYEFRGNIEKILFHGSPELRVGYRLNYFQSSMDADDPRLIDAAVQPSLTSPQRLELIENLVPDVSHREGFYVSWRDQFSDVFHYNTLAGVDYAFDRQSIEYYATGGFSVFPRKSFEIRSAAGYISSANTADSGSDQWQVTVALKYYF